MRNSHIPLIALLIIGCISSHVSAAAPQVIATTPPTGDGSVAPGLVDIRVTFDQPMDRASYSFATLGSGFPDVAGQPYWIDDFTILLPVHLQPGAGYWLMVNSPSLHGFRNRSGEPAAPYLLAFWTADGTGDAQLSDEQAARNRRTFEQVVELMTVYYSYKDRLGIDWAERMAASSEWLLASPNDFIFGVRLIDALAAADDVHLFLRINDVNVPSKWPLAPANYNVQAVLAKLTNVRQWSPAVISGEVEGVGYVLIAGWVPDAAVAAQAVDSLRHKEALIVDVRPNGGGDERIAQHVAGCFAHRPLDYAKSLTLDPDTRAFTRTETRTLQPNPACGPYIGQVVVLTGPQAMSSNESFLLMMREAGATLLGAPSYGSSGNPRPYELDNGLVLYVPQWQDMDMDGRLVEGNGVAPDIMMDFSPEQFAADDPVFDAAVTFFGGR